MNLYHVRYRMDVPSLYKAEDVPANYNWTTQQSLEVTALSSTDAELKATMWLERASQYWWQGPEGPTLVLIPEGRRRIRLLDCELLFEAIDKAAAGLDLPEVSYHDPTISSSSSSSSS